MIDKGYADLRDLSLGGTVLQAGLGSGRSLDSVISLTNFV